MKPVKRGDSIRKALTARWFNEQNKSRSVPLPPSRPANPENPVKILCIADSGTFDRFDAATIVGPMLAYEAGLEGASQHSTIGCKLSTSLVANKWGIVQGPCGPGTSSKFVVLGLTWANFELTDNTHTHVKVESGALTSGTSGDARIISPPPGTAPITGTGLIYITPPGTSTGTYIRFTLTTDLTSSGTATVNATSDTGVVAVSASITVLNYSNEIANSGARGTAVSFNGTTWFIVEVNRPPILQEVLLTCNSHDWTAGDLSRGFAADQTDPITFSTVSSGGSFPVNDIDFTDIEVLNTYNHVWLSGDTALVMLLSNNVYEIVDIFRQTCLAVRFELYSDAPSGLTPNLTVSALAPDGNDSGEPPSGSFTVKDIYGVAHNAKMGHYGVAHWDFNNEWWYAIECQHIATRFIGTLQATLSGGAATISVTPVTALNGILPSGTQTVYNKFSWDAGTTGHNILVEWDPVNGQWFTNQMRCPA